MISLNQSAKRSLERAQSCSAEAYSLVFRAPSYEGARITPRVAAQNPTHAQSRQGDSKRYLEGLKRKRDSN